MNKKSLTQLTLLTLTALALIGVIAACAPPPLPTETPASEAPKSAASSSLEGVVWQLESYVDADGNTQPALADAPATLIFQDGKFMGDTHCNGVAGEYTLDGDKITIKMGPGTLRACEPDIASQESGMRFGLSHAASYKIEDGKLMLMDADGNVLLTFIEQPPVSLSGHAWQLVRFNNGNGGMESNQAAEKIYVTFGEDGKVSGNAGCNNFSGSYEVDGDSISIGPLATTRKMCAQPEGVMETEQAFLQNLDNAATFSITGDTLTLFDKDGGKLLVFSLQQPITLTSTPWRLQSFNNGKGGMATTVATQKITAIFTEDGRVSGNAGCNTYNGGYQIDGDSISIGPLASTEMYCNDPADVMETENAFLKNMSNAARYAIENGMLTLYDQEGKKLLVFLPAQ